MRSKLSLVFAFTSVLALAATGCGSGDTPTEPGAPAPEHVGSTSEALTSPFVWSGQTWTIKSGNGLGPGPNNWAAGNVSIDGSGSLNLAINKSLGKWYCAEVYLASGLGYGTYEFFVKTNTTTLDKSNVMAGFLYQDDNNEYDVEWSRWGNASNPYNGDFADQGSPFPGPPFAQLQWHQVIGNGNWQKWRIIALPTSVEYQVETNSQLVQDWFAPAGANIFNPANAPVHINNWLFRGTAPAAGSTLTLVSFTFTAYVTDAGTD